MKMLKSGKRSGLPNVNMIEIKVHFGTELNSEIYIDKTGLLEYTNKEINTKQAFI